MAPFFPDGRRQVGPRPQTVCSLCCLVLTLNPLALAQSIPVDAIDRPQEEPAQEPPRAQPEPVRPPVATRPKPISTEASYPPDASGDHEVVLELKIDPQGRVEQAVAVQGQEPFTSHAEAAARAWRFEPASVEGKPVGAKIRFLLRFTEPAAEPEPEAQLEPAPEPAPAEAQQPPQPAQRRAQPAPIEVVVRGERAPQRRRLGRAEVRELPGAFGDPFRAIEVLPGVVPIMSGVPYFYVRGAPPGNVGYFFDGIPVPMLYHFAAGPGVLHPAFVENVDLYAAAYPARYGRFAGAIVAGEMAPPRYDWRGEAGVRLIDSGGMVEAPFAAQRGSLMLGGRYSYTGLVLSLIVPELMLQYWDYQGRTRYALDDDDSVEILLFGSGDLLTVEEEDYYDGELRTRTASVVDIAFHRIDLRWDRELDAGRWRNALMLGLDHTAVADGEILFTNRMLGARSELQQTLQPGLTLRTGVDVLYERLTQRLAQEEDEVDQPGLSPGAADEPSLPPGAADEPSLPPDEVEEDDDEPDFGFDQARNDLVFGVHGDLVIDAAPGVEVIPGLRTDLFLSGNDAALGVDPRMAARFAVTERLTLTHGLGIAHQSPSFVIPIPGAKPSLRGGLQSAVQYGAGVEYELGAAIHSSLMLFHNVFFNLTDLIGIVQLSQTEDEEELEENLRMTGRAYGAEVMLRRSLSRDLGGFVSYTISRSERFRGRLEGPATTDRTHVLNLALSYNLGRNWRFGNRLLLYSGIPARVAYLEAARHPPRTPPYWRIDWRLQKRWPSADGRGYWGFVAEVLNTTLNKEVMDRSCSAYVCVDEKLGPVTVPSVGVEAAF
jgi:TonB family protein